jgi:vitellogenic carboxypeptidase-like protein
MRATAVLSLLLLCSSIIIIIEATSHTSQSYSSSKPAPPGPRPLHSGYFDIDRKPGSALFYAYWEAASPTDAESAPILLWLQGGPGCASTFGAFYELGPLLVSGDPGSGQLQPNNFSWHSSFGLLVIDQPVGEVHSSAIAAPPCRAVLSLLAAARPARQAGHSIKLHTDIP